ncbi:hypothetical protein yrohd0001_32760 [Yersinia rohdei ATCC 43380]|nr:hypothetical protein yrohd0001_32760 [Yersinia rohdei ATCC 43380]
MPIQGYLIGKCSTLPHYLPPLFQTAVEPMRLIIQNSRLTSYYWEMS